MYISTKSKWIATDGWRGYLQPVNAIGGANCTGDWEDSPCPTHVTKRELNGFKKILRQNKIPFRQFVSNTSNVFCVSVYLLVPPEHKERGLELSKEYSNTDGLRLFYSCN
jgi:hypothetical protein